MKKEFKLSEELTRIWNETPYMENPTRTELADKINSVIEQFIKLLKEYLDKECKIIKGYPISEINKLAGDL